MVRFITKCEDCEDSSDLFWCSICTEALCSPCWDASRAHRKAATKARHAEVKTPYGDYKIMEDILRIEKNENQRTEMHRKDRLARWIGIGPAPSGEDKPELWDWSRMPYLIHEATHMSEFGGNQYPSVAAFIGNTGAPILILTSLARRLSANVYIPHNI